jgi:hypothetical protein
MHKIYHVLHIQCLPEEIFPFISTREGLKTWWTKDVAGDPSEGGVLTFSFGVHGYIKIKVLRVIPNESVLWDCLESTFENADAWDGTQISIHINPMKEGSKVRFEHENWKEEDEEFAISNYSWASYLRNLKQICESGKEESYNA